MRRKLLALGVLLAGSTCGCVSLLLSLPLLGYHLAGGRVSTWHLRDGTEVHFFKRSYDPPARDNIKVLVVARPGQPAAEYTFARWHTGYRWVELRADAAQTVIWIVDTGADRVGCSLDLTTGVFADEGESHPLGVGPTTGEVVPRL